VLTAGDASAGDARIGGQFMTQEMISYQERSSQASERSGVPDVGVRLASALLALAIAAVHVADQGSVTVLADQNWIGWGYRLIEAGGILTALALLLAPLMRIIPAWLPWAAGVLLGAVPFLAYLATRSIGLPGDHADVGNWGDWVGTVALLCEAALVTLSVSTIQARRRP
jgi:hypothetical protein